MLDLLAAVPDPRNPRGVRYALAGVLAVAVTAVLAGARSFAAIGEWAADLPGDCRARIGLAAAPDESTLRNTAISLLRLNGWTNIAKALRHHARDPERALTCLLTC